MSNSTTISGQIFFSVFFFTLFFTSINVQGQSLFFKNVTPVNSAPVEAIYVLPQGGFIVSDYSVYSLLGLYPLRLSFASTEKISAHTRYGNKLLIIGSQSSGNEVALWAVDGLGNNERLSPIKTFQPRMLAANNNDILIAGDGSVKLFRGNPENIGLQTSPSKLFTSQLLQLSWCFNKFWALEENGSLHFSADGLSWTQVSYSSQPTSPAQWLYVTQHNNEQIFVLQKDASSFGNYILSWSKDGNTWKNATISLQGNIGRFAAIEILDTLYFSTDSPLQPSFYSTNQGSTWQANNAVRGVRAYGVIQGSQPIQLIGTFSALLVKDLQRSEPYQLPIPAGTADKLINLSHGIVALSKNNVMLSMDNMSRGREFDISLPLEGEGLAIIQDYFCTFRGKNIIRHKILSMPVKVDVIDTIAVKPLSMPIYNLFANNDTLFCSDTDGNIFFSSDIGVTWTQLSYFSFENAKLYNLLSDGSRLFFVIQDNISYSIKEWNRVTNNLQSKITLSALSEIPQHFTIHNGYLYTSAQVLSRTISIINLDSTSDRRSIELPDMDNFSYIYGIAAEGSTICVGTSKGLLTSFNRGLSWQWNLPGVSVSDILFFNEGNNLKTIFVNTKDNWIFYSENSVTSVNDIVSNSFQDIEVFPNPATDIITFRSSDIITSVEIVDVLGNIVYQINGSENTITLLLPEVHSGLYNGKVRTVSGNIINTPFIITK